MNETSLRAKLTSNGLERLWTLYPEEIREAAAQVERQRLDLPVIRPSSEDRPYRE